MKLYTSLTGQTLWDISLQIFGTLEFVWELAIGNNLPVDQVIPVGTTIKYNDTGKGDETTKKQIKSAGMSFVKGGIEAGGEYSNDYNDDYNT